MPLPKPPDDDVLPAFAALMLVAIIGLFAVRNLPWHLDDLDQAKQAYVSFQMLSEDRWLVQNTPTGDLATKPPLQGWLSTAIFLVAGGSIFGHQALTWEFAWRLPPFVASLLILWQLWRTGTRLFGNNIGGVLAAGAFGLNSYVPRLATLVRTDMLLTAFIFFVGWMSLERVRRGEPWLRSERAIVALLLLGALLTKGPVALGFLLPGMVVHAFLTRRRTDTPPVFCGWLWWLLPLAVFGAWTAYAWSTRPAFADEVIGKEFLGRFTFGRAARHGTGLPGEYTLGLLARTLPWTLLLVVAFAQKAVRAALRTDPALLWLTCWTLGGLVFMELVPAKRFDRILPVVPPMCLLLAAAARHLPRHELSRQPIGRLAILLPFLALLIAGGYAWQRTSQAIAEDARALVRFGMRVRTIVGDREDRLAVLNGKDEGMLLYLGVPRFTRLDDAMMQWRAQKIDWLVIGDGDFEKNRTRLDRFDVLVQTPPLPGKFNSYRLLQRVESRPPVPPSAAPTPITIDRPLPTPAPSNRKQEPAWVPPLRL